MATTPVKPLPPSVDVHSASAGLRTVATFEAVKGGFVLLAGFGLLALLGRDAEEIAQHVMTFLHLNPTRHSSQVILNAASQLTDAKLWALAAGAAAYSTVRFVEAYGLWHRRVWAQWFAMLSGIIYLPIELYEILVRSTPFRWAVLFINLFIVLYMFQIRLREQQLLRREARAVQPVL